MAYRGSWNYTAQNVRVTLLGETVVDDIGFLRKLLDGLVAEKIADPSRIYIAGTSQGGFLAYSVACELSERVAALAPMLANMTEAQIAACKPSRIAPMAVIASPADGNVLYDGRLDADGRMTSIPETMDFWRKLHGCSGQTVDVMPKLSERNPTRTWRIRWTGCRTDGALRQYRVNGAGHTLPTREPWVEGRPIHGEDFETVEELWAFFKDFRL